MGGGPRASLWHLRTLTPLDPYLPEVSSLNAHQGGVHAIKIIDGQTSVVTGGDLNGSVYISSMSSGQTVSEIKTTVQGTTYSLECQTEPFKFLAIAGSSATVDLCTANFDYKDRVVNFPLF